MGSFDYTCSVSGLSISAGHKVKFLPVVNNHGGDCYVNDNWMPYCIPFSGKYNDYGSIESYEETHVAFRVFQETIKQHVKEQARGENKYHESRVDAEMSVDRWLNSLQECRVVVVKEKESFENHEERLRRIRGEPESEFVGKEGQPSAKRIEAQLERAGFHAAGKEYPEGHKLCGKEDGFTSTDLSYGFVRVNWSSYEDVDSKVQELYDALGDEYQTVLVPSNEHSWHCMEILVFPKPNDKFDQSRKDDKEYTREFEDKRRSLKIDLNKDQYNDTEFSVEQSMIREDIWNFLAKYKFEDWHCERTLKNYIKCAEEVWEYQVGKNKKADDLQKKIDANENDCESKLELRMLGWSNPESMDKNPVYHSVLGLSMGKNEWLGMQFKTATRMNLSKKDVKEFCKCLAELCKVEHTLALLRHQWRSGFVAGPQSGHYIKHRDFHRFCAKVSNNIIKEYEEDGSEFKEY